MRARHHDVSDLSLGDLEHALEHRVLLARQKVSPPALRQELGYILSARDFTVAAMDQPGPPTGT